MDDKSPMTSAERDQLRKHLLRELKPAVEDFVRAEVKRQLGEKAHRDAVQELTLEVLFKFFRNLANRNSFFKNL